jgi:hypothetical protein
MTWLTAVTSDFLYFCCCRLLAVLTKRQCSMTDSSVGSTSVTVSTTSNITTSSGKTTRDLRLNFLHGTSIPTEGQSSNKKSVITATETRDLPESSTITREKTVKGQSQINNKKSDTVRPVSAPPRSTLLTLFPPEKLKKRASSSRTSISSLSDTEEKTTHPFKTTYDLHDCKDFASAVHPTAPRVPAPSPSLTSPTPNTVRGPKGVSHPQLKEFLQKCKAKFQRRNIAPQQSTIFTDIPDGKKYTFQDTTIHVLENESRELTEDSGSDDHSSTTSTGSAEYHDAYADLVKELATHESKFGSNVHSENNNSNNNVMPVHETAFLPQGRSPQRGTAAPWIKPTSPTQQSDCYTTTDDEYEGVQLRRAYSSRHYDKNNIKFYDQRTRSLSPPAMLVKPSVNRASTPVTGSNQQQQQQQFEDVRRIQSATSSPVKNPVLPVRPRSVSPLVLFSPEQMRHRQELHAAMGQQQTSPQHVHMSPKGYYVQSPLARGTPNNSPASSKPLQQQFIIEEGIEDPPMMRRSYSLNAAQIRDARRGIQSVPVPAVRTQNNGLMDNNSQKRVSFGNIPNSNTNSRVQQSRMQYPPTPTHRPSSSDSVFLYSPIEAPDKPLPPVPEDRITPQVRGRSELRPRDLVMSNQPTRWQAKDNQSPHPQRYLASPESESGSEAGEIQRILFKQSPTYANSPGKYKF